MNFLYWSKTSFDGNGSGDEEKQKLIISQKIVNKEKDAYENNENKSEDCKNKSFSDSHGLYSEQKQNGHMLSLTINNCDKLPTLKSTLIHSDDNGRIVDNGSALEKQSESNTRSSMKYCNKDTNSKENLNTTGRKMSVIFSEENSILIQIAPQNTEKVIKTVQLIK